MSESEPKRPSGSQPEAEIDTPSEPSESSSRAPETPQTEAEQAKEVEELLAGLGAEDEGATAEENTRPARSEVEDTAQPDVEQAAKASDRPATPATLSELAERLDLEAEELYKVEVKAGDGTTATLGDLKDAWQERETAARETAARAAELDQRESALIADQRIFAEMGDQLAAALPQETRSRLTQHLQARAEREHEAMLRTMPELAEPETMAAFKAEVTETLEQYGFRPAEMQITDHRHLHILRDLVRLKKRMERLGKWTPDQKPARAAQPRKQVDGAKQAQVISKARRGSEADKVAGVAHILKGS